MTHWHGVLGHRRAVPMEEVGGVLNQLILHTACYARTLYRGGSEVDWLTGMVVR